MKKTPITVIKLGGSLITFKRDKYLIDQYLDQIDRFMSSSGLLQELSLKILDLINFYHLRKIFKNLSSDLAQNPKKKIVIIHGAGSIGHSLVLHLLKNNADLETVYPIIKLTVAIQNQIIVSEAIKHGINAISFPSHLIMRGKPTEKTSVKRTDSTDLTVFEQIITETNAVPVFYGDVGHSSAGWKVFSGDVYPTALSRRLKKTYLESAIFLTNVEGKKTGIYTKDPKFNDAEFISLIEVENNKINCFGSEKEILTFQGGQTTEDFDVTEAMGGKLRNLIELANNQTHSWVVGFDEFNEALNGGNIGTRIIPKVTRGISVTFLGTGDAFASGGGKSASTFIKVKNQGILLDCGPHTLQALKNLGRKTNDIDLILISHFHGDHFGGIPFFLLETTLQQNRTKPLTIIGPPNIENQVNDLYSVLYETIANQEYPFPCKFQILTPTTSPLDICGLRIKAFKMLHTPEAQGYRIETNNSSIAYSGDTGWTEELLPLVKDTQLAILECNFFDTELEIHLNYHQLSRLKSLTDKLALIHLGSEVLDRFTVFEEEDSMFIPEEGQTIRL
ncbi:MAG: MBL fold metallo-hydrolase [Candidatus Heimdallarchaeota archaeon]|nr:MAG: MBL fold metallo-hydrolase [Candidatus Heimdallarchaeota archaeon]